MTDPRSTPMEISSDVEVYRTCPAPGSIAEKNPFDFKVRELKNVKDFKRSRFDEVENYQQKRSNQTLRVCKVQRRPMSIVEPLEVEVLRDILSDHPRIVRLHEAIMYTHTMQLYFDYYPGGDLHGIITRYFDAWEPVPESFIWHCALHLSEAVAYIHHGCDRRQLTNPIPADWQPIIHGDIKPENVFLGPPDPADESGYPSLVLGDFGLATIDEHPVAGTWKWQPPELPMTSKKADVWAMGAVLHALAHEGNAPLRPCPQGMSVRDYYRWPAAREPRSFLEKYSTDLHNLVINGTLVDDPCARYSSLEVLQCVIDEVELGEAVDLGWEPLIGYSYSPKTYDENGVTEVSENTAVNTEESIQELDRMNLCEVDPAAYHDPMEYAVRF